MNETIPARVGEIIEDRARTASEAIDQVYDMLQRKIADLRDQLAGLQMQIDAERQRKAEENHRVFNFALDAAAQLNKIDVVTKSMGKIEAEIPRSIDQRMLELEHYADNSDAPHS